MSEATGSQKPVEGTEAVHTGEPPWPLGRLEKNEQGIWRGRWKISEPRPGRILGHIYQLVGRLIPCMFFAIGIGG